MKIDDKKPLKTKAGLDFCIFTIDGVDYSCFDSEINKLLQKGEEIGDVVFTQKGKYKNLTGVTKPGDTSLKTEGTEKDFNKPIKTGNMVVKTNAEINTEYKVKEADKFSFGMASNQANDWICHVLNKQGSTQTELRQRKIQLTKNID